MSVSAVLERLAARIARWLVDLASWVLGAEPAQREWLQALRNELEDVPGGWSRLVWAVGGVRAAWLLDPGRGRRRVVARLAVIAGIVMVVAATRLAVYPLGMSLSLLIGLVGLAVATTWQLARGRGRPGHGSGVAPTADGTLAIRRPAVMVAAPALAIVAVLGVIGAATVTTASQPDTQCTTAHTPSTPPPTATGTAADFLALGDYDYDRGDCSAAIADYTSAIELDPGLASAYNDRAYTAMRRQDYAAALPDLDRAIQLRPDYANALMNRGDIYNYYYAVDRQRAIADYNRVIALGDTEHSSVCGHRLLAYYDGWKPEVLLNLLTAGPDGGCHVGQSST